MVYTSSPNMAVQRVLISSLTILLTLTVAQSRALIEPPFLPIVSYATGAFNPLSVAIADVNGDGKSDLVVANQCSGSDFCVGSGTQSAFCWVTVTAHFKQR